MIDLSEEQINRYAPYCVKRIDCNSFIFTSQYGVILNVGFADDYMLLEEGAYQFFIVNANKKHSPNDPLVKETVSVIIREFFQQEPAVILYICDTSDNRQRIRDRLFTSWFEEYAAKEDYTMLHESVDIDNVIYYGSLLMRKDHPLHEDISVMFHDFAVNLPSKLDDLQNGI